MNLFAFFDEGLMQCARIGKKFNEFMDIHDI
jgi:hypothetical protein